VRPASPRVGLVVGRAVGNSVVRHRVSRRLRAAAAGELHRLPPSADLVLRARPEAAAADFGTLRADLAAGLDRLLGGKAAP
jgi:ribonuclease P protein component